MSDGAISGAAAALTRLNAVRVGVPARLAARIDSLATALQDGIVGKLSGEVLHRRSGRLAASIAIERADTGDSFAAIVGVTGPARAYAPVLEYGGTISIRAHLRVMREAWGRPLKRGAETVAVRAHSATYPARSFLRAALAERAPEIVAGLGAAVTADIDEAMR